MKSRHTMDLTTGSVWKKLLTFVYPLMIANLLQHLYQATDNAVVGRFVSKSALAAVGSTGSATTLILNMIIGLSVGASIVNGNLLGAKKHKELRKSMHTSLLVALAGGILVAVFGNLIARPMLLVMSCPESVIDDALVYMRIILCGAPGTMIYNFGSGILRTHGDSKRPMIIMAVSGLCNVLLNLVFVLCFHMTVDGVAYATVASKYISAIWVVALLFDPKGDYKLSFKELKLHWHECMNIIKVGVPCGINGIIFSISNVIVQSGVNGFGADVMAGNVSANNITAFLYQVLIAFYSACVSFSGQCFGAQKLKRIDRVMFTALGFCCSFVALLSLVFTIYPNPFLSIFNSDPEVIKAGASKLIIMSWSYVLYAASEIVLGCLRGMRRTSITTAMNIFCVCGIRLIWLWCICPIDPANPTLLYFCYPVSYVFSLSALAVYYIIVRRKLNRKAVEAAV